MSTCLPSPFDPSGAVSAPWPEDSLSEVTSCRPLIDRRDVLAAALFVVPATVLAGCRSREDQRSDPPNHGEFPSSFTNVEIGVDGTAFRPVVELIPDSSAEVQWFDLRRGSLLGTGVAPTLKIDGVHRVGLRVVSADSPAFEDVITLNLGFNRKDDYGRLSLPSRYEHEPQPVVDITRLRLLTSLVRFCASRTPMAGRLDLSGLSALEHVECYRCEIESIELAGCSSLVRLCVEDSRLTKLDLQPVRHTLRDLRAAIQRSDGLTFAPLDGPMEALYHYCVRDQPVSDAIPHSQLPVIEEYWAWATGQRTSDAPTSPLLRSYLASKNPLDQASVDAILISLDRLVNGEPGRVDLSGRSPEGDEAAAPSAAGVTAASALVDGGWRVSTN